MRTYFLPPLISWIAETDIQKKYKFTYKYVDYSFISLFVNWVRQHGYFLLIAYMR